MRLSDLQKKNVVNLKDGKNIGNIIDANINENGNIESLVLEVGKTFLSFNRDNDIEIKWQDINKIGEDVILVKPGNNEEN